MAWLHADYITLDPGPAKVAKLRLHILEVSQLIGRSVSADGKSIVTQDVRLYQQKLEDTLASEEAKAARIGGNNRRVASFAYGDWPNRGSGPVC